MRILPILLICALPVTGFAAGSDDPVAPKPTQTTKDCKKGEVWDEKTKKCKNAEDASLNDDQRFEAVREYAYFGSPETALAVLATMQEGETDRVLTYLGFATRKAGDMAGGMAFYARALEQNPDNILARSYMGQALVLQGDIAAARRQLDEIRARGGAGSWAEASLAQAVGTGQTLNY